MMPPTKDEHDAIVAVKRRNFTDGPMRHAKNSDDRRKLRHLIGVVPLVMIAPNLPISSVGPAGIAALDFAGNS